MEACCLPFVPGVMARTEDDAAAVAALVGYPVVLKVSSPDVLHKTEAHGVAVHLDDDAAVRRAFRSLAGTFPACGAAGSPAAIVVQPMFQGVETLVGVTADPLFGPLVGFGLGGTQVEALGDVAFRLAPMTEADADDLIRSVRAFPLLQGHRGAPPVDLAAVREVVLRTALLSASIPEIKELDFNPAIALPAGQGCRIVDARIKVG
jgi:acyl-CoA synthetase (NDP forming)